MNKVSKNFFDNELGELQSPKKNWLFIVAFIISLLFFSWLGYLILTEKPPVSEQNFFESFGFQVKQIPNDSL